MATQSRKESTLYIRGREGTAGTEDDYDFWQADSCIMTKHEPTNMKELNRGKLGHGEHGTDVELLALYTPFSVKCSRLSEVLYFLSFFQGTDDNVATISAGVYNHFLRHQRVTARTLPTFTMLYADGSATYPMTHCIVNDFSITLAVGGNGMIDATFNGFCNTHNVTNGVITLDTVSSAWSSGNYDTEVGAEPLVNMQCCNTWLGTATEADPQVQTNQTFGAEDLAGTPENISAFVNSITFTGNNGLTAENLIRQSGCGILNNQERGDRTYTMELNIRKDDAVPTSDWPARSLADTQCAVEVDFVGKQIGATGYYHAMSMQWPVLVPMDVSEDDESPISYTVPFEVFQSGTGEDAFLVYGQTAVDVAYNTEH